MKGQRDTGHPLPLAGLLALGLISIWAVAIAGCRSSRRTVNVTKQVALAQANRLEIAELVLEPEKRYEHRLTVTDAAVLSRLTAALDENLALVPLVDCLPQYQLSFGLAAGGVEVLDYYCEGGMSFLHGAQAFWSGQQVQPPAEFDAAMSDLLKMQED